MCKKQASVSHSSTESEIISLDAGLRMDGILAPDLWDMMSEVFRSTNNTARPDKLAQGDLCEVFRSTNNTARPDKLAQGDLCTTGDHSINKLQTKHQLKRECERLSNGQMRITFRPTHILLIGPVIEVHVVQVFGNHGLECDIPSPNNPKRTSWVVISSGKSRFVDEVHIPNAELRSSAELLTGLQKAEGGESCLGLSKTSIQETGAVHVTSPTSIKETCADSVSFSPSPVYLYTKRTIPTTEKEVQKIFLPIHR